MLANLALFLGGLAVTVFLWRRPEDLTWIALGFSGLNAWQLLCACRACGPRSPIILRLGGFALDPGGFLPRMADHRRNREQQDARRRRRHALGGHEELPQLGRSVRRLQRYAESRQADSTQSHEFSQLLRKLRDQGIANLMAMHDLLRAKQDATHVDLMRYGKLVHTLTAAGTESRRPRQAPSRNHA